jgi:hypothetical protein
MGSSTSLSLLITASQSLADSELGQQIIAPMHRAQVLEIEQRQSLIERGRVR